MSRSLDEVVGPTPFDLDGSSARFSPSTSDPRSAAEDDKDDAYDNGYVPYVWEEEDAEDDHILHLHDGDDDDASSEGY